MSNLIQLLSEFKMIEDNWSAWTEDSYASTILAFSDQEIKDFYEKSEEEIEQLRIKRDEYYNEYVKD